ncbi:MAG: hypothetical protein EXR72_18700 [Myxococcales bacterium]|nr:hypothetical protein [Myxococcales bacterium]
MSTLTEQEGCAVLKRVFEARGYRIQENTPLRYGDVSFNVDGWDTDRGVGYEYITKAAGDHDELTPEEMATLSEWNAERRIALFMIDEADVLGAPELEWAANRFLDDLAARAQE